MLLYNPYLTAVAVVPAIYLMIHVYRLDRLDREPLGLLLRLVLAGAFSTVLAVITEVIGSAVLDANLPPESLRYRVLMYFVVVAVSEEGFKYLVMKKRTWNNPNFDCQFDGVVYAVYTSLGFALWENIKYVYTYGFLTGIMRAVTAVPGHASFGVFMGVFYGMAKLWDSRGYPARSRFCRRLAVFVPVVLHGAYDFIATDAVMAGSWVFTAFVIVLFLMAVRMARRQAKHDAFIFSRFSYFS